MEYNTWRLLDEEKNEDNRDELIKALKSEGRSNREVEEMLRNLDTLEDE